MLGQRPNLVKHLTRGPLGCLPARRPRQTETLHRCVTAAVRARFRSAGPCRAGSGLTVHGMSITLHERRLIGRTQVWNEDVAP